NITESKLKNFSYQFSIRAVVGHELVPNFNVLGVILGLCLTICFFHDLDRYLATLRSFLVRLVPVVRFGTFSCITTTEFTAAEWFSQAVAGLLLFPRFSFLSEADGLAKRSPALRKPTAFRKLVLYQPRLQLEASPSLEESIRAAHSLPSAV